MNRCVNGTASGLLLSGSLQREKFYSCSQTLWCLAAIVKQCDRKTRTGTWWTVVRPQQRELRSVRTWTRGVASSCKAGSVCPRRSQASGAFFNCATGLGRSLGTGAINQRPRTTGERDFIADAADTRILACTRFHRHRVRCFDGTGGESWKDGSLLASSSLRLCG
jgi:hypothetical protein